MARADAARQHDAHKAFLSDTSPHGVRIVMSGPLVADDGTSMIGSLFLVEAADRATVENWPLGCMYHSRSISVSCSFAKSGSTSASGMQWNAKSQAAYHGYSHLSGMEITSALYK